MVLISGTRSADIIKELQPLVHRVAFLLGLFWVSGWSRGNLGKCSVMAMTVGEPFQRPLVWSVGHLSTDVHTGVFHQ